jgi:penicillin-binding protein 1A
MGVRESELERVPSLVLGTSPVTLREMVAAYGTLANGGTYQAPVSVTQVEDRSGTVLATFEAEPEAVISEATARSVYDMLRDGVDYGTSQRVRTVFGINADVAGKTGTTQGGVDGWFLLMHPDLVAGAWVGFDDPRVAFRSDYWGQGAHNALYVVGDFYRTALRRGLLNPNRRVPEPVSPSPGWRFADDAGSWAEAALEAAGKGLGALWQQVRAAFESDDDVAPEANPDPRPERGPEPERRATPEPPRPPAPPGTWTESPEARQERLERTLREVLRRRAWREHLSERIEEYVREYDGDLEAMLRDHDRIQRDVERELERLERELERLERDEHHRHGW